jgi:hypothetical protein
MAGLFSAVAQLDLSCTYRLRACQVSCQTPADTAAPPCRSSPPSLLGVRRVAAPRPSDLESPVDRLSPQGANAVTGPGPPGPGPASTGFVGNDWRPPVYVAPHAATRLDAVRVRVQRIYSGGARSIPQGPYTAPAGGVHGSRPSTFSPAEAPPPAGRR